MSSKPSILHIPIKREYFDAILSGEKTEEYRGVSPFWISRLAKTNEKGEIVGLRQYDIIRFRNGYNADSRQMYVQFKKIIIEEFIDVPEESEHRFGFVILLGKVLRTENM